MPPILSNKNQKKLSFSTNPVMIKAGEWSYRLLVATLRKSVRARLRKVDIGFPIKYLDVPGKGEPVVVLHGFSDTKDTFLSLAAFWKQRPRLILPDLPGFGESAWPQTDYSLDQYSSWLLAFVDKIDLPRFHLFGHSLGGAIATQFAVRHPEKVLSLAVLNSGGVLPPKKMGLYKRLEEGDNLFDIQTPEEFQEFLQLNFYRLPPTPFLIRNFLYNKYLRNRDWYNKLMKDLAGENINWEDKEALRRYSLNNQLEHIKCPTLIIWGKEDAVTPLPIAYVFQEHVPHAELQVIEEAGHCLNMEKPKVLVNHYRDFLTRLSQE